VRGANRNRRLVVRKKRCFSTISIYGDFHGRHLKKASAEQIIRKGERQSEQTVEEKRRDEKEKKNITKTKRKREAGRWKRTTRGSMHHHHEGKSDPEGERG